MVDWIDIPEEATDPGHTYNSVLAKAWTNRLIAAAAGAPGSPSFLPNIAVNTTAGGVGTYVFALATGGDDFAFGDTVAGSRLLPSGAARSLNGSGSSFSESFDTGVALSGTWICMGHFDRQAGNTNTVLMGAATLWFRIA